MKYLKLYFNDESYMTDKPNLGKLWVASTKSEKHVYYSSEINNSLCFTAMENNASVQIRLIDSGFDITGWQDKSFYYKKNNDVEWTEWVFVDNETSKITLNKGEKLYVRSDSSNSCCVYAEGAYKKYIFDISEGKIAASGNIMSLLNFTPVVPNYAFYQLFIYCSSLVSAPALPATTLADHCYNSMFSDCTALTQAPALPATTLAYACYDSMFSNCSSLTQAPELPATTLVESCYNRMFSNCSSLTQAPALTATTLVNNCYNGMFTSCSSLTQAPELPATTLAESCYWEMFAGCTQLNYIKALFTTTPDTAYTNNWVYGVSPTGTFVKSKDAQWDVPGVNGIPTGWTVTTV